MKIFVISVDDIITGTTTISLLPSFIMEGNTKFHAVSEKRCPHLKIPELYPLIP